MKSNFKRTVPTKYKLHDVLKANDPVFDDMKHSVLLGTDIFISTSRFEGHPMAVIEAMAYGIPCILTKGTNMLDKLVQYDAGWETELDSKEIGKTIITAIDEKEQIIEKGTNAKKLVEENYTWNIVAKKTVENYNTIMSEK